MRRFIVFALLVFAAWTAWKKYPSIFERQPQHEAVIENATGVPLVRLRLHVGDQTLVRERVETGQSITIPFGVNQDVPLGLAWELTEGGERTWSKGQVTAGPMLQRHVIRIEPGDRVIYDTKPKPSS